MRAPAGVGGAEGAEADGGVRGAEAHGGGQGGGPAAGGEAFPRGRSAGGGQDPGGADENHGLEQWSRGSGLVEGAVDQGEWHMPG